MNDILIVLTSIVLSTLRIGRIMPITTDAEIRNFSRDEFQSIAEKVIEFRTLTQ